MAKGPLSLVGVVTLLIVVARQSLSGEAVRPRGVRPDLATFYDPSRDFQCLDGSTTITFEQVNDDYCDCRDGSDEPGTSACPNANFYCPNRGFKPSLVSHQQPEELELIIVGTRPPCCEPKPRLFLSLDLSLGVFLPQLFRLGLLL